MSSTLSYFVTLANILMDSLYKKPEERGRHLVRYTDDFVILVKNQHIGDQTSARKEPAVMNKL
jgi:hypothetical protein